MYIHVSVSVGLCFELISNAIAARSADIHRGLDAGNAWRTLTSFAIIIKMCIQMCNVNYEELLDSASASRTYRARVENNNSNVRDMLRTSHIIFEIGNYIIIYI